MTPSEAIQHLRVERRSYIVGALVVLAVVVAAEVYLFAAIYPGIFHVPPGQSVGQRYDVISNLPQPSAHEQLILQLVSLTGGLALFFLNWRFSLVLRRPRRAFPPPGTPASSGARWLWWAVLAANSFLYQLLVPQLVLTWVLARWGSDEIRLREHDTHLPSLPTS